MRFQKENLSAYRTLLYALQEVVPVGSATRSGVVVRVVKKLAQSTYKILYEGVEPSSSIFPLSLQPVGGQTNDTVSQSRVLQGTYIMP